MVPNDLSAEINQYIAEVNKRASCDILAYWSRNKKVSPSLSLSLMASCFLGIPATSAPSKRVFSRSKTMIGSQCHILKSSSIEHLLCVKECYQKFDEMIDTSTLSSNQVNDNAHSSNDKDNQDDDDLLINRDNIANGEVDC
ncbi:hypothetical protein PGT21_036138 [Puccinia graminis f. sp. tritici]|uniref:HAT C-terminal dimerisation domain-containing protein n=1 Tax=Puccinia graminis f. sp. tritici TaxID=56615 RepID=A0A5B0NSE0_PUCGR|nr:hypothetical protein PGTUg99_037362 [Puccinia graminis f. sp. tritici]KAA1091602.1 hypothetical protein PGT21_036138 [Puccinia graminis f. sp. tritici]